MNSAAASRIERLIDDLSNDRRVFPRRTPRVSLPKTASAPAFNVEGPMYRRAKPVVAVPVPEAAAAFAGPRLPAKRALRR